MKSIKIVGIIIPIIAIILATLSHFSSDHNLINRDTLNSINSQKAFTQEISKNIFFIYKNKDSSTTKLESLIKKFLDNKNSTVLHTPKVIKLWNKFYSDVQKFRTQKDENNMYSSIYKDTLVKKIYNTNLELIVEFDKSIDKIEKDFITKTMIYKSIEYILYGILILLLVYLATKLHEIIGFIQKFLNISKNILQNSTIKGLKPIKVQNSEKNLQQAGENFNSLVSKIDISIKESSLSLEHSYKSLEYVEENIENLMDLINSMDSENLDKNFSQKEDAVIHSLEEITRASKKLKNLKKDLKDLISDDNTP